MNLNFILSPWTLFFIAMIIIVVMLIFLTIFERKLKKRIAIRKEEQTIFQRKLKALNTLIDNPPSFLVAIDELARDFLSQHYKVDRNLKYSELVKIFRQQDNKGAMQFCERIQETFYAGESVNREHLQILVKNLEFLILELSNSVKSEKQGSTTAQMKPSTIELDTRIVNYLSEGTKRGFALELLHQKLLGANFSITEIKLAEEYLNLNSPALPKTSVLKEEPKSNEGKSETTITNSDHKFINSLDNLERIKGKISDKGEISGIKKISGRTGLV